uniref:(northern house mosquito) hypothetical protein n=1 Tax=Culex pipiens TaxID=7175 RepID=A0A8D8FUP1_CULPI
MVCVLEFGMRECLCARETVKRKISYPKHTTHKHTYLFKKNVIISARGITLPSGQPGKLGLKLKQCYHLYFLVFLCIKPFCCLFFLTSSLYQISSSFSKKCLEKIKAHDMLQSLFCIGILI